MKISILGTGTVGSVLGDKLIELGYDVMMSGRAANNPRGQEWLNKHPERAQYGTFADAGNFGDLFINCIHGIYSIVALEAVGEANLANKTIIDLANELDFSTGKPNILASWQNCLAERIQERFPKSNVVKSLNTINCYVMVNPSLVAGDHSVFLSGNSIEAKAQTRTILRAFGWRDTMMVDLGNIETARGPEMLMALWIGLWGYMGNEPFNVGVFRKA